MKQTEQEMQLEKQVAELRWDWEQSAPPLIELIATEHGVSDATDHATHREMKWRSYQDAYNRLSDQRRRQEIEASQQLALTNTQLAGSQMWIAFAVAGMTAVQLFITIVNWLGGRH